MEEKYIIKQEEQITIKVPDARCSDGYREEKENVIVKKLDTKKLVGDMKARYETALATGYDPEGKFTIDQLYNQYIFLYKQYNQM